MHVARRRLFCSARPWPREVGSRQRTNESPLTLRPTQPISRPSQLADDATKGKRIRGFLHNSRLSALISLSCWQFGYEWCRRFGLDSDVGFSLAFRLSPLLLTFSAFVDKDADDIPLLNVKSTVLKKVVEYMRYHAENPPKDIEKVRGEREKGGEVDELTSLA